MYSSLTAVVLCIFMQAAAAQCAAPVAVVQHARESGDLIKHKPVVTAPPLARTGGELIKTAAASTHDDEVRGATHSTPVMAEGPQDEEQHRRSGPAMLLAALALMSGIALRRFGAHKE